MATADQLKSSIGCLSTVFPQFVAKELAALTDDILSSVQGFTDPLAAIGDLNVDSLVEGVSQISEGDVFSNLGEAAIGLTAQYVQREVSSMMDKLSTESGYTKRIQAIQNIGTTAVNNGAMVLSIYRESPYIAAQWMCETIIQLSELKRGNLSCLAKHITQLSNCMLVLVESSSTFVDGTLENLALASERLVLTKSELNGSQRLVNGKIVFDGDAFERARLRLLEASSYLTPDKDGTSILDAIDILSSGSVEAGQVNRANQSLVTLAIPSLIHLIEVEMSAVEAQINTINFYISKLSDVIANFRRSQLSSQIVARRNKAIAEIKSRINELCKRIDLARASNSLKAISGEMLLWSSRAKSIIVTMNQVKELTLQEGSLEGPDKALALEQAFQDLLSNLVSIEDDATVAGIESPVDFKTQVFALTKGARRLITDIEGGKVSKSKLATFHLLASEVATGQVNRASDSRVVALKQTRACEAFAEIDIGTKETLDKLVDSMRQIGLDRGADLFTVGDFTGFLDSGADMLSYLGVAINCLSHALEGIDDSQTRKQIAGIRDQLVAKKSNQDIAAIDSSDRGRSRFISKAKANIASIQRNAKIVESIVDELTVLAKAAGASLSDVGQGLDAFLGNIDHLAVGAGGRLASGLEEFSDHPNAGVVLCEAL